MTDMGVFARPFEFQIDRWSLLLDKCCEHRPWFDDATWADPVARRATAAAYLGKAAVNGMLWEVWRGPELTGAILLNDVALGRDASAHFVFFDRKLADKRQLCLNAMAWAFKHLQLEVLRTEVPTYARALAHWARNRLGFSYEAEARRLTWPANAQPLSEKQAELGSRRYRATLYEGSWHDLLLLSITREEFAAHERRKAAAQQHQHGSPADVDPGSGVDAAGVHEQPPAVPPAV